MPTARVTMAALSFDLLSLPSSPLAEDRTATEAPDGKDARKASMTFAASLGSGVASAALLKCSHDAGVFK